MTPRSNFRKEVRCRTLVAHGLGSNGGVTPSPADLRSMVPVDDEEVNEAPVTVDEQLASLGAQLKGALSKINSLERQRDDVDDTDA